MNSALLLAIVMLVGVVLAFAIIHSIIRRVPYEDAVPRERFRWPVWNWYPMVVIGALVVTMSFAIYHASNEGGGRTADDLSVADEYAESETTDFELVAGKDTKSAATGTAGGMTTTTSGSPADGKKKKK